MKFFLVLCATHILLTNQTAAGQHLMIIPLVEKTVTGYEYGSALTFQTTSQFSFGIFYQGNIKQTSEGPNFINPFYGIIISAPLIKCNPINFYANTRMGFVNRNFLLIVPGIETEIKIFSTLNFGIGMSVRKGFVSAIGNIKFKI